MMDRGQEAILLVDVRAVNVKVHTIFYLNTYNVQPQFNQNSIKFNQNSFEFYRNLFENERKSLEFLNLEVSFVLCFTAFERFGNLISLIFRICADQMIDN